MANEKFITSGTPGGLTNYKMVYSDVTFATGAATVTAASLGVNFIKTFFVGITGATTAHLATVVSTTASSTNGYTSIDLECHESDGTVSDLDETLGMVFICE